MKAILLDGYGTLVKISEPRHPFRRVGGSSKESRRSFYEKALSTNISPNQLLVEAGESEESIASILVSLHQEVGSIEAYPESIDFLNHLDKMGIPWLIVSNLAKPYCEPLLKALSIDSSRCRFSCETGLVKPDPRSLSVPCSDLGFAPSDVMMIGDSVRDDVGGAFAAGLQVFHLDRDKHTLWDAPLPQRM